MHEILSILPEILGTLAAGGWLISRWRRKQEKEAHAAELRQKEAILMATLRDSETKYTREALEIYTTQVVKPIREELARLNEKLIRYEEAFNCATSCRIYPDCVVLARLQKLIQDNRADSPPTDNNV